eukprot:1141642-Pelagomonas_calceolata.AAC.2
MTRFNNKKSTAKVPQNSASSSKEITRMLCSLQVFTCCVGGYETITGLYDDPDKLEQLIPDNRMKMLARSMMEARMCLLSN